MAEALVVSFERHKSKIRFGPASPTLTNAFPLKDRNKEHFRLVNASPFSCNYGFRVAGSVAFNDMEFDCNAMLVLELDKPTRVSRVTNVRTEEGIDWFFYVTSKVRKKIQRS